MAAHKSLKFGSKVRVTNKSNGNSATVTITDRGPLCERSLHRSDEGRGARPWIIARVETFPLARPMGFSRVPSRSSVLRFGSDFQKSGCSCLHRTVSEPNKIVVRRSKRGAICRSRSSTTTEPGRHRARAQLGGRGFATSRSHGPWRKSHLQGAGQRFYRAANVWRPQSTLTQAYVRTKKRILRTQCARSSCTTSSLSSYEVPPAEWAMLSKKPTRFD